MYDVITLASGQGIGSTILLIIKTLIYKKLYNRNSTLYVDSRNCPKVVYTYLHKFIHFVKPGEVEFIGKNLNPKFEFLNVDLLINGLKDFDPNLKLELSKYFFNRHFSLQDWVINIIKSDEILNQQFDFSIMVRRGCKIHLEPHLKMTDLDSYIKYIDEKEYKKIFVASDTYSAIDELRNLRPNLDLYSYLNESDKGFFMWEVKNWSDEYTENHIIKFIKELIILSKTKETMSDINSNVFALTLFMRDFDPETIIFDKNIHPTFNWKTSPYFC